MEELKTLWVLVMAPKADQYRESLDMNSLLFSAVMGEIHTSEDLISFTCTLGSFERFSGGQCGANWLEVFNVKRDVDSSQGNEVFKFTIPKGYKATIKQVVYKTVFKIGI